MEANKRLKELVDNLGVSQRKFSQQLGLHEQYLSNIINGTIKNISFKILKKIKQQVPNLNFNWLLFGEGTMYLNNSQVVSEPNEEYGKAATKEWVNSILQKELDQKNTEINRLLEIIDKINHTK